MWYDIPLMASIRVIQESPRILSEKQYKELAKKLGLLSSESLRFITGLNFGDFVRSVRKKIA